jgi:hypothetical protein
MNDYDEELNDDNFLDDDDDELLGGLKPLTSESGDLLDDSNPFGYDDIDDFDDNEIDEDEDE